MQETATNQTLSDALVSKHEGTNETETELRATWLLQSESVMLPKPAVKVRICSGALIIHALSSFRMTLVRASITLAWYKREVWSSIRSDSCVPAGTLFTELTFVLRRA